jgi:hypothetical protein
VKKLLFTLGLMASVAGAKDMTGRLGVGGSETLGGNNGLTAIYQLSKTLTVDGLLGFTLNDGDMALRLSGHALLNFADFDNANMLLGAGLNIRTDPDADNSTGLSLDFPARIQVFFNDRIAAHAETGFNFDLMQPHNDNAESVTIFQLKAQLLGAAGLIFYF